MSDEDFEKGYGIQTIEFKYNDTSYSYDATLQNDWFDVHMINYMNYVLEEQQNPKRLYIMSDGGQGCIVFYCTKEWAEKFEKTTGYSLEISEE